MIFEYFTVQNWTDYTEPQHIHIKVLHMIIYSSKNETEIECAENEYISGAEIQVHCKLLEREKQKESLFHQI